MKFFGICTLTCSLALGCLLFVGGPIGCKKSSEPAPDVILLHTGRMRGNAYPADLQSIAPLQHYQYLSGYIKSVREKAARDGTKVLLVDLGDSLEGSFAAHATGSENMVTLFNSLGYDAVVLSNLDNALKPELLARLKSVVLNPFANSSGQPATEGSVFGTRFDKAGLPVSLMANFYGDATAQNNPDRFPAWFGNTKSEVVPFRDYLALSKSLGPAKPGELSLLTWMKIDAMESGPTAFLEELRKAGVDAVMGHRIYGSNKKDVWSSSGFLNWNPPVSLNILRNNGGFALARMDLRRNGDSWEVLAHEILPMTANTAPADPEILQAMKAFGETITKADKVLTDLKSPVSEDQIFLAYTKALASVPGTDVVLYSKESIRSDWNSGELRASEVFNSLPWTTGIVQMTLTSEQISKAGELIGLVASPQPPPAKSSLTVTTSEFFGRIIATRLGLDSSSIRTTENSSEYDFFVNALVSSPDVLSVLQKTHAQNQPGAQTP